MPQLRNHVIMQYSDIYLDILSCNISYLDILRVFKKPQKEERSYFVLYLRLHLAVLFLTVVTFFSQNRTSLDRIGISRQVKMASLKDQFIMYS